MYARLILCCCCCCCCSVQRSNCYMVCGADAAGPSSSSRNSSDLEIGCMIDLATGLLSFTANGKELSTTYQVNKDNSQVVGCRGLTHKDSLPHKLQYVHIIISLPCGKYTVSSSVFHTALILQSIWRKGLLYWNLDYYSATVCSITFREWEPLCVFVFINLWDDGTQSYLYLPHALFYLPFR